MSAARRRVAITGIGLVTPVGNDVATTWAALDGVKSGAAPITLFDACGFTDAHRRRSEGLRRRGDHGAAQAAQVREPLASLCAGGRRAGDPRCRHRADRADGDRWGCAVGTGMMGVDFRELSRPCSVIRRPTASSTRSTADRRRRRRSAARSAAARHGRRRAADAPLRHPRLRDVGAHGVRVGRPGDRHRAQADPPRRRRPRARRRIRFDDQPGRPRGILPAFRGVDRQRHAASARAVRSMRRATASCWAKARAFSCSRNGNRRAGAARASMPSSPATAIRCRRTGSPTRRPTATGRSSRCARRSPTRARRRPTSTTSTRTARRPA